MQFMCLFYPNEAADPKPGKDAFGPFMQGYNDFTTNMRETGSLVHADALQPVATATTVAVRDGKVFPTDGPFAETNETLGGYYLLDCANLGDAIAKAAQIPTARYGRIEVRPVVAWE